MGPSQPLVLVLAACLAACSSGNVKSAKDYSAPAATPVRNPLYNPYAAYDDANAIWQPPVWNRDGTIVKPAEPSSQDDRPPYEFAPWATGAADGSKYAPPGTFRLSSGVRRAPTTQWRYQGTKPPESPIILHVQQPEGAIVGMLPINDPLIPWRDSDCTWPTARVALTAIARIAPPSASCARRTPRARVTGCPRLSPL